PRQATIRCRRPRADSIEVSTYFLLLSCFSILLDACVPLVALILPIPALSAADVAKRLHQFDHHHILGLLVAELPFEAETERRAVRYIEGIAVELVRQNRLRVIAVGQGHALVVGYAFIVHIGAMEDDELGSRQRLNLMHQIAKS